ncbi:MAG: PKD domain-containing protein [Chitinophagales bacterium]|jgi:PKD repeat protein|nr:PKD domain-containing protein [Chitinophagales bacterium]
MKNTLLMLLLIGTSCFAIGQQKYYEHSLGWLNIHNGWKVLQKNNSNYLMACEVFSNANNKWNSHIVELDSTGTILSNHNDVSQPWQSAIRDIVVLPNGYIASGLKHDLIAPNDSYTYLFRMVTTENVFYETPNVAFDNVAYHATVSNDNSILLAGSMVNENTDPISFELHLIKVDSLGVEQWHQTYYNFTKNNTYEDIIALPNGTFYGLATIKDDYWQQANIALLHLSATGIPISIQEYNLGGRDLARCLIPTNDGGLLFSATSYPTNNGLDGTNYLYKLNSAGETQWINNTDFQATVVHSMVQLADSTYVVAGNFYATEDYYDAFIAKLDTNGSVLWRRTYGGDRNEYLYDLIINNHNNTGKDGYVMCGRTESTDLGVPLGNANVYFLKTNCMGLLTEPQAQFSYLNPADNIMEFQNLSQYVYPDSLDGGHYLWDFGDGFNTNEQNPTHTYTAAGVYNITLTAIVCNDTSRYTQTICVGSPSFAPLFSYQTNSLTATYINQSTGVVENQGSFIWNFGDGATSVEQNPMHTYTQSGSYAVELQAIVCSDTLIYRQTVVVVAVGLNPNFQPEVWTISPNPAKDQTTFGYNLDDDQTAQLTLYDLTGRLMHQTTIKGTGTYTLQTNTFTNGLYLYTISNNQGVIYRNRLTIVK